MSYWDELDKSSWISICKSSYSLPERIWSHISQNGWHMNVLYLPFSFNSLAPGGFENIFQNVFFKLISRIDTLSNSCETALRSMPQNPSDDKSTLVQVMAWCRQAASHYLSQCCPRSLSPYGVTRPQWVNASLIEKFCKHAVFVPISGCQPKWLSWNFTISDIQILRITNLTSRRLFEKTEVKTWLGPDSIWRCLTYIGNPTEEIWYHDSCDYYWDFYGHSLLFELHLGFL